MQRNKARRKRIDKEKKSLGQRSRNRASVVLICLTALSVAASHLDENNQPNGEQEQPIEVGSEILLPISGSPPPSDDNVRQKLDSGAILVQGEEELPLEDCCDRNGESRIGQQRHQVGRSAERRRGRSRSLVHEASMGNGQPVLLEPEPPPTTTTTTEVNGCIARDDNANATPTRNGPERSATLPRRRRRRAYSGSLAMGNPLPPHRVTPDGTAIYYWCELPRRPGSQELDDGAYNPLWTMRGFTQTFHFWKETKRAQSVPLNAFLTYITLPWWSIAKDILDHREGPILTF